MLTILSIVVIKQERHKLLPQNTIFLFDQKIRCGMAALTFVLVALLNVVSAQFQGDKVIRVVPQNEKELEHLNVLQTNKELMIEFWKWPSHVGLPVDMHVSNDVYKKLAQYLHKRHIKFTIQMFDVQRLVDNENSYDSKRSSVSWYGKYHPLNEIYDELKRLARDYYRNGNVLVFTLGKSHLQQDQKAIMIKGKRRANKPVFFMNCGIHAREWVSQATCMYIAKQLLSRYGKDSDVTAILDKMDFVIVPVVNPDGYVHTWTRYRFWRKTMKPNKGTWCVGTDPNRNWDFKWGEPGASADPCNDAYRGPHAFSEIETKNVADYLKRLGTRVKGYMDIHAYSQLWMIPWGYTTTPTPDHQELMRVSNIGASAIRNAGYNTDYKVGPSSVIIYKNSGGSKDYTYGVLGIKYSFALELRDKGTHGFLLPASQIIPTGLETFEGIKAMAKAMKI